MSAFSSPEKTSPLRLKISEYKTVVKEVTSKEGLFSMRKCLNAGSVVVERSRPRLRDEDQQRESMARFAMAESHRRAGSAAGPGTLSSTAGAAAASFPSGFESVPPARGGAGGPDPDEETRDPRHGGVAKEARKPLKRDSSKMKTKTNSRSKSISRSKKRPYRREYIHT